MSTSNPEKQALRPSIIVIDDDEAVLNAITFNLTVAGYHVTGLPDGQTLLDSSDLPDTTFLIVDHRLPHIDGLFLIEMLRARGCTAPAVLVTSQPSARLRDRCNSLGIPLVEKPLLQDELASVLQAAQR